MKDGFLWRRQIFMRLLEAPSSCTVGHTHTAEQFLSRLPAVAANTFRRTSLQSTGMPVSASVCLAASLRSPTVPRFSASSFPQLRG